VWLYWEKKLNFIEPKHVAIPVAVSVFPDELYTAPRSRVEQHSNVRAGGSRELSADTLTSSSRM
jgi:hypothetical protein